MPGAAFPSLSDPGGRRRRALTAPRRSIPAVPSPPSSREGHGAAASDATRSGSPGEGEEEEEEAEEGGRRCRLPASAGGGCGGARTRPAGRGRRRGPAGALSPRRPHSVPGPQRGMRRSSLDFQTFSPPRWPSSCQGKAIPVCPSGESGHRGADKVLQESWKHLQGVKVPARWGGTHRTSTQYPSSISHPISCQGDQYPFFPSTIS